jgi:flagellar hook-length control protein FliK
MKDISILNLFNFTASAELPKQAAVTVKGEFENVFKKYLDRSETSPEQDTANIKTAEKQDAGLNAEEPATPDEVIDSLDIPDKDKQELKNMLDKAETKEDMQEFADALKEKMTEQGMSLRDVEKALADMAIALLNTDSDRSAKDSLLLEEVLDKIMEVQKEQTPRLVKQDEESVEDGSETGEVTDEASENAALTAGAETLQAQQNTQAQNTANPKMNSQNISADTAQSGADGRESAKDGKGEAQANKSDQQIPAELKAKIAEIAAKMNSETQKSAGFDETLDTRSAQTEKVVKAEVKVEGPRDIMKFAELIEIAKSQKATKIHIQLTPQELGRVNIELSEQAGKVSGKVTFESESARNLFTSNAEALRQHLADKGVMVENLEFGFKDLTEKESSGWENRKSKNSKSADGSDSQVTVEETSDDEQNNNLTEGIYA